MKIFKSSLLALFAIAGVAMTSCSDDDKYVPGPENEGAYFGETASVYEIDVDETSFPLTIKRTSASTDATVTISVVDESGLFSIPTSATFNGSEMETTINVVYDAAKMTPGVYYPVALTVTPSAEYGMGYTTYDFSIYKSPWVALGNCTYTDAIISELYGAPTVSYEVPIEENFVTPGVYRLVNPYGEYYPYNDPGDWDDSKNYYMVIDASNPERVLLERSTTGCDWGDGALSVWSMAGYYLQNGNSADAVAKAGFYGTLEDGVISWTKAGSLVAIDGGGMSQVNRSGEAKVVLPAAE